MTTVAEHPGVEDVEPSFADAARAFLDAHASRKDPEVTFVWGEGNDGVSIFEERDRAEERRQLADATAFLPLASTPASGGSPAPRPTAGGPGPAPTNGPTTRSRSTTTSPTRGSS